MVFKSIKKTGNKTINIFVIPSWFPPNGGSFFVEQTVVLKKISRQVVLYVQPVSLHEIIKNPFLIKNILHLKEEKLEGLDILRRYYIRISKSLYLNLKIENICYSLLYKYAVKKYGRPDIIHVHSSIWAGWIAYKLKIKHNIPYIITEHRSRFVNNKYAISQSQLKVSYNKYLFKIFSNASYIMAVSNSLCEKINFYISNSEVPVKTVYNMCNEDLFYVRYLEKREKFTFITVAGLEWVKGIDILISSFQLVLKDKNKDLELLIIGEGSKKTDLEKMAIDLKIKEKVQFLGNQDRESVAFYMSKSHVFVLPTRYEAFGVVYAEALLSGLPIIGTKDSGGPQEIIIENENGYLVEIDDIQELALAMKKSIYNLNTFNTFNIARKAKEIYGYETFVSVYSKIYNLVNGKKK